MRDIRFHRWVLNDRLRHEASGKKEVPHLNAPGAKDLGIDSVKRRIRSRPPGNCHTREKYHRALGEAYEGRKKLNATAYQIEWETSRGAITMASVVYMRYLSLSKRPFTSGGG